MNQNQNTNAWYFNPRMARIITNNKKEMIHILALNIDDKSLSMASPLAPAIESIRVNTCHSLTGGI